MLKVAFLAFLQFWKRQSNFLTIKMIRRLYWAEQMLEENMPIFPVPLGKCIWLVSFCYWNRDHLSWGDHLPWASIQNDNFFFSQGPIIETSCKRRPLLSDLDYFLGRRFNTFSLFLTSSRRHLTNGLISMYCTSTYIRRTLHGIVANVLGKRKI